MSDPAKIINGRKGNFFKIIIIFLHYIGIYTACLVLGTIFTRELNSYSVKKDKE